MGRGETWWGVDTDDRDEGLEGHGEGGGVGHVSERGSDEGWERGTRVRAEEEGGRGGRKRRRRGKNTVFVWKAPAWR